MTITFLAPHLKIAGGTRIFLTYASLLAKRSHQVKVFVVSKNCFRRKTSKFFNLGIPHWINNFSAKVVRVQSFDEIHLPESDAIIATTLRTADYVNSYSGKVGRKFYLVQHDEGLYHENQNYAFKVFSYPLHKIVVSTWLHEVLQQKYHCSSDILLNPTDKHLFHPVVREEDNNFIRILMLCHDYEWKGTREGVAIVKDLKDRYPNVKLILYSVRRKKTDLFYNEYYYKLPQKKLSWLYSNADIFLCPSWDEGSGLPSMEAMACKCALITYDNGGSRDYAFDGQTALVAKRRDKEDLSNKLKLLITNESLRKRIMENGYKFIQQMPTWEEQTEKLENILKTN